MTKKGVSRNQYRDATGGRLEVEIVQPLPTTRKGDVQTRLRVESRQTHIAHLISEGLLNQVKIVKELGRRWGVQASRGLVQKDIKKIREEWRQIRVRDADVFLGREIAKLDRVEAEAWKAWHDSRQRHITDKEKDIKHSVQGAGKETEKITKDSTGDPRYLDIVQSCIDKRCKLLGIAIPEGSNNVNILVQQQKTTVIGMSSADLRHRLEKVFGVN